MIVPHLRGTPLHRVLVRTVSEFLDDEMSTYASALAYQMLFSLFPFLLFLIALIGFLHLPDFFSWLRLQSELVLPPQALEQVNPVIDQLQQSKGGLLSVGIVIALWTASAGVRLMMSAMNAAYDVPEGRPVWKRIPLSIFYTIGIAGMLLAAEAQPKTTMMLVTHLAPAILEATGRDDLRVDGIEASGLGEDLELLVDRTPKRNHLARSTPELIVKRLVEKSNGHAKALFADILDMFANAP